MHKYYYLLTTDKHSLKIPPLHYLHYFVCIDFPPQEVVVSAVGDGVPTAGDMYTLECTISRGGTLDSSTILEVMWLDMNNDIITAGNADYTITGDSSTTSTTTISTITFNRVRTSHGGTYSCSVNMTIPDIVTDHQVTRTTDVTVASKLRRSCDVQCKVCDNI